MRYLNIFLEMAITEMAFLIKAEKRSYFWVRMPVTLIIFAVLSYFAKYIPVSYDWGWIHSFLPLILGIAFVVICYKLTVAKSVCFGIVSYSIQHTAFILHSFIITEAALSTSVHTVIDYCLYFTVLALYWLLFGRNLQIDYFINLDNIKSVLICVLVLIASYASSIYVGVTTSIVHVIADIALIMCIFLALALLFGFSREDALEREKADIEEVLRRGNDMQRLSKENIELLNQKCHDLKHRIEAVKCGGKLSDEDIKEIEKSVALYDGFVHTGSDDLDIVLAEKYLRCNESRITLACIADGKLLRFMSPGDIYSLFGNALDNAIEYLQTIADAQKRIINVMVNQSNGFICISVENYCESQIKFIDGMPETIKKDKRFHGFGIKSMNYIVKKYGGTFCCSLGEGLFKVSIIFPKTDKTA